MWIGIKMKIRIWIRIRIGSKQSRYTTLIKDDLSFPVPLFDFLLLPASPLKHTGTENRWSSTGTTYRIGSKPTNCTVLRQNKSVVRIHKRFNPDKDPIFQEIEGPYSRVE
jgi:hypothetical protein